MRKQFIIILLALLVAFGLMVSCKNEVADMGFGEELVSVSFKEDSARGLTASIESFDKQDYYWAYAAQKADGSQLISGQTANYGEPNETRVWIKTDSYNNPVIGLGTTVSTGYEAYKVPGFSQGYWNFRLYAYKRSGSGTTQDPYTYQLVYQGETLNVLLKSDSVNTQGSHLVNVIVDPVQSEDNGTMVFLTNKIHPAAERISMNTVNSAIYGEHYTVKVLSILSIEDFPVEYVDAAGAKIHEATDSQDGEYTLPAGSYKVTVAFTDSASAPTLNYARGTIVATVYSNLTTTISGDLTEAMTYAEFDGELNPDLETVTISSEAISYDELHPTTQVSFSSTGTAKAVTATTTKAVTNQIIQEIAATNGTNTTEYNQSLVLTLNVETVESTATTATYEIGMSATLTSSKSGDPDVVTTSDVSEVDEHVTIVLQLQPGLDDVNVLHDGHQMAEAPATDAGYGVFSYDKPTGELMIVTKSFSPFEVSFVVPSEADYVAQVGNLKFLTLADAIAKAASNSTVTLLKSITSDAVFNVVNGRLDLAGYTITGNVTASENGAIIKNGSITGTLTAGGNSAQLQDLTVTGKISIGGTGAVLENCTVTGTGDYAVEVTAGNATIKSGTYKAADNQKILNGSILVEDGNFKGSTLAEEDAPVSLIGGIYEYDVSDDESAFVADGYECIEVSTGVFKVRKATVVRNVTKDIEYYTLNAAFEAADSGDELLLLNSTEVSSEIAIAAGKTLSLDLGGKVITGTEHVKSKAVFRNAGNLTIVGTTASSAINADATAVASIAGSTLTVNGGSYSNIYKEDDGGAYLFDVNGTATINGVTLTGIVKGIRAEGSGASVTVSDSSADVTPGNGSGWGLFGSANGGELIISSGTYRTTYSAQRQMFDIKEDGHVTVNGGSFETVYSGTGDAPALVVFNGGGSVEDSLTITGGVFKYAGKFGYINGSLHEVVSITGGTFDASSVVVDNGGTGNVLEYSITGGTFHTDPSDHLAEGYTVIENDGWYTVGTWAARIGTVGYETLAGAWSHATSEDTIVLLKDISAYNSLTVSVKKTIDLGGHALSLGGASSASGAIRVKGLTDYNGDLTITNGVLNLTGANYSTYGIYSEGNLTLTDVTINSACQTVVYVDGLAWNTPGTANLTRVTINSTHTSGTAYIAHSVSSWGTLYSPMSNLTDCTINSAYNGVNIQATNANLVDCDVTANENCVWIIFSATGGSATGILNISGESNLVATSDFKRLNAQNGSSIVVYDGTYNFDPSNNDGKNYVAEGYQVVDNHDGTWTVSEAPAEDHQVLITKTGEPDAYMSLAAFRDSVNEGNSYSGYTVTLQCDVNLNGNDDNQWIPIGSKGSKRAFAGIFDGNNHVVSNLYFNNDEASEENENVGFFGLVENAVIENLTVSGEIKAYKTAAGIAGRAVGNTYINNVISDVAVTAWDKAGGIIGAAYSNYTSTGAQITDHGCEIRIINCTNSGDITCLGQVSEATHKIAGAIVGQTAQFGKTICEGCTNSGEIIALNDNNENVIHLGGPRAGFVIGTSSNNVNYHPDGFNAGIYIFNCVDTNGFRVAVGSADGISGTSNYKVYVKYNASDEYVKLSDAAGAVYYDDGVYHN